jgi:hypothetical protein
LLSCVRSQDKDQAVSRQGLMIRFLLLQNRQGKTRLSKWWVPPPEEGDKVREYISKSEALHRHPPPLSAPPPSGIRRPTGLQPPASNFRLVGDRANGAGVE